MKTPVLCILFAFCTASFTLEAPAQSTPTNAPPRGRGPLGPQVVSPEVAADRHITFRVLAPKAEAVRLSAGDIPGNGRGAEMTKGTNGVWEVVLGPIESGAYRYNFNVDGVSVIDPRNPATSESNNNTWSLVNVPGSDASDTKDVPHGAVSKVSYYSKALGRFRRMHVYTPPGYESGKGEFPVFYLLHGAGDCDDSWTSVGRAGFILDNLIAAKKAKPMIVVMPAGHTRAFSFARSSGSSTNADEFIQDFTGDVMPYVEKTYRVRADRGHRAVAGLSMGGAQTLNLGIPNLEKFAYLGVFSSGVFGITTNRVGGASAPTGPSWEERNKEELDNVKLKKGLKLVWFGTGKDDFLVETSRATVAMLKKHGFDVVYSETAGAHTWLVWRQYLSEFAPQLFQ
ncbi:MAG TPA: alpha/beta hydrolase-fold protein [Candidatus Binatia bacterium]|nr:alpha/beta hydrolase-fold protein [Candidatus Binatia bacterium]